MQVYIWEGKTRQGKIQKGEIEAVSEPAVRMQLGRQKITPSKIKAKPKDLFENIAFFQPKVTENDLVIFTRQFSTMIDAGLPLVQALDILSSQQDNKTFKKILVQIKGDIEGGATFTDALKKHPNLFDELYVNLVAAGEVGGILDSILNRLAGYIEKTMKLKKKVKGAMVYPISILGVAVIVVVVLLLFVIPVFQKMFAEFGAALPAPTQIVIKISEILKSSIIYIAGSLFVLGVAFKKFHNTEKGKTIIDDFVLKLPVFGPLIRKAAVAKFTRTLGTMISSGVPILDGLDITAKTAGNKTVERSIYYTKAGISEGRTIAEPLAESKVFPPMVVRMIAVGEATGALDAMLGKIADFYDDEVDAAVDTLTAMLEPMLMVFLGVVLGGLVIAMYLPIFKMAAAIG
ncbi:MAG: pilus assembly protein PilC [Deltaproteobacteria bacterium CG12_big_fil_rev_8_21_14_0_65_43_10]|nr:MAG: pilus assembly protein PilC [Deltaproteobacteria bacterium CG2_30_43_15]PIQ45884.1 MAG: pilus assembly protein PilC [Deltaproteobacteria bacterium CG12_big_fil_rev_8_21_14_0_65_43_10]PIU85485.1 MAG: pilus assembly protein PilC [Deltaproteobacteria bacterium CG06_land_8_20_14_3_00_44_19]PIX23959.1 MAG: pilus assembly protein PilC [Deltaproteobacteria bacterium CG_4_8_14_3_um_filter_43_13]PIZ19481.1 MAG: pilus assembly protein PilC [Deltaproteobacteria bacterium CG_4_10_14_0_8_um_filter_4